MQPSGIPGTRRRKPLPETNMRHQTTRKYDRHLIEAVRNSVSLAGVLRLRMRVGGGNYRTIRRAVKDLNLDISHWSGKGHRKGSSVPVVTPIPLTQLLARGVQYHSHKLRLRLIAEGIFDEQCSQCHLTEWQGCSIPLELDHRDGDRDNNELSNLRLLCPNCHALTPTYRGRNKMKVIR